MTDEKLNTLMEHLCDSLELADCSFGEAVNVVTALLVKLHIMKRVSFIDTMGGINMLATEYYHQFRVTIDSDKVVEEANNILKDLNNGNNGNKKQHP